MSRATAVPLLAGVIGCMLWARLAQAADKPEDAVKAAYKSLETAVRNGDGQLWLNLQSKSRLADMPEQSRQRMLQSPFRDQSIRYEPNLVRVQAKDAVLVGKFIRTGKPGAEYTYHTVRFALEDGQWKIAAESMSQTPIDPNSIWALLPPEDGAFTRAGSPWPRIKYAELNTRAFQPSQLPWKMQATEDESFLYIRFEAASALPAPGAEIHNIAKSGFVDPGAPSGPPSMVVKLGDGATQRSFEFQAGAQSQSRSTFDAAGKANSIRYFVSYSLMLSQPTRGVNTGSIIFTTSTTDLLGTSLVAIQNRFFDLKIPLKAAGWTGTRPPTIQIQEFNSFAQILPYQVVEFEPSR